MHEGKNMSMLHTLKKPTLESWPPRDRRPPHTVTPRVTAPPNHARLSPGRPLGSSRWATSGACPYRRAASTGAALASVVACATGRIVPTLMGTPHPSSSACGVGRFDTR
jgi:hypothetical protein